MKLIVLGLIAAVTTMFASDKAPDWATELSTRTVPTYSPDVHSVGLLAEEHVTVQADGNLEYQVRHAVRILNREGGEEASAFVPYFRKAKSIRELRAWLITKDRSVKEYRKDSISDVAAFANFELYDDVRGKWISAANAPDGSTFAWEAEYSQSSLRPQKEYEFQNGFPVLTSRYVLTLPAGWQADAKWLNHPPVQPEVNGSTYTWTLTDLPAFKREKASPALSSLVPRIAVAYGPGEPASSNWTEVSSWFNSFEKDQATTSAEMAAKVQELTAGQADVYAKVQAIGSYVQKLKYVAIEVNTERGGGYQPHPAAEVFEKQYGDCKDKANLMRAMLKLAGIDSYMVTIYSGDRNHVRPDWVTTSFNHAIIAVSVPNAVAGAPVLKHPAFGNLLFFDPTDPFTPVGDLPEMEQGSYALVDAPERGGLVQVPVAAPETNKTEVDIDASVNATGGLDANIRYAMKAQSASELRGLHSTVSETEFKKIIEAWVAYNVKDFTFTNMSTKDDFKGGNLELDLNFKAPAYAQNMQGRLLVIRPSVVRPFGGFPFQTESRVNPVVLNAECYRKQTRIKLPSGFKVDEMPDAAQFTSSFGRYHADYKLNGDELVFTEELDVSAATLPAADYLTARHFFEHVAGAEQQPVVLVKN